MKNTRRTADVVVERFNAHVVRHAFAVAGESCLDALDALYDARRDLQIVTCRHEAAAAKMAKGLRQALGARGHRLCNARPRDDAREPRRAHGNAGCLADGAAPA